MNAENTGGTPKWLEDLQQKSWEPEILLSGIVLYGMFKVPDLLDDFLIFFKANIYGDSTDIDNLVSLFKIGVYWLIGGLILHLICRGIWIGMVGLSYTFPTGINHDKLKYTGKFKQKVERTPSYEQIVMRLEKISSSLFSLSFMLFMSLIGGYAFFFILVILPFFGLLIYFDIGFSGTFFDLFQYYVMLILAVAIVGLGDFLTMGFMRRFKWFARIWWPFHKIISILTFSRFYRPIYYGMVSHLNKWVVFLLLAVFVFGSIFGTSNLNESYYSGDPYVRLDLWDNAGYGLSVFSGYYQDQNADKPSARAHIPSDVISGDVLRLFLVADIDVEDNMLEFTSLDSLIELYPDEPRSALKMEVVGNYYHVLLDTIQVSDTQWFFHYNLSTGQRGYLTYLNVSDLEEGVHQVTLRYAYDTTRSFVKIPFYRDRTFQPPAREVSEPLEQAQEFQPKPFGIRD